MALLTITRSGGQRVPVPSNTVSRPVSAARPTQTAGCVLDRAAILSIVATCCSGEVAKDRQKSADLTNQLSKRDENADASGDDINAGAMALRGDQRRLKDFLSQNRDFLSWLETVEKSPGDWPMQGSLIAVQRWRGKAKAGIEVYLLAKRKPILAQGGELQVPVRVAGRKRLVRTYVLTSTNGTAHLYHRLSGQQVGDVIKDCEGNNLTILAIN